VIADPPLLDGAVQVSVAPVPLRDASAKLVTVPGVLAGVLVITAEYSPSRFELLTAETLKS
jgi:hypothetical protein